jgi:ribosome-binding protein aMBF1 (putative translation factor)
VVLKVRGLMIVKVVALWGMNEKRERQIKEEFGARVRAFRVQKGLSQEALALACGLDRSYIGGVERGERNISIINIHKIAEALGIPAGELL